MIKRARRRVAKYIMPKNDALMPNFYAPRLLYIEFEKGTDYFVYCCNSKTPKETSGEQLQAPFETKASNL